MKKIYYIITILCISCLWGCDNECCDCGEDTITTGNFKLVRDWGELWQGITPPEVLDVYFHHASSAPFSEKVYNDTTHYDLIAGEYHILAVNTTGKLTYSGMDNFYTAKANLPVYAMDSIPLTTEAPVNIASHVTVYVPPSGYAETVVSPAPLIKIISFTFKINRAVSVGKVCTMNAFLSGVQTSTMLCIKQPVFSSATLPFTASEKDENIFQKNISILGFAENTYSILDISLETEAGIVTKTSVDLTNKFDFSVSPVQNCIIEITIDADSINTSVDIFDWEEGIEDIIELI